MNAAQAGFVDWIHPSVRDTVIEYLREHDGERLRFLRNASARGVLLAVSTGGGASGRRSFPLLHSDDDWAALENALGVLARGGDSNDHMILLSGINHATLAHETTALGFESRVARLGRELLIALQASWSAGSVQISVSQLDLFYDLSRNTRLLVPSPALDATWDAACAVIDEILETDELTESDVASAKSFARLVRLVSTNEPRFFAIIGYDENVGSRIEQLSELVATRSAGLEDLEEEEDEEYDDGVMGPVEPDYAESTERRWLKAAIDVTEDLIELGTPATAALTTVLEKLESHAHVREQRKDRYDDWERQGEDDDGSWSVARSQGSGDFDLVAFFSDL